MTENLNNSGSDARQATVDIPAAIFRAYDIRGIVDEQLSPKAVRLISRAIGSEALAQGIDTLYVGYDGRLSSPALSEELIQGLRDTGCSVISLGLIPTPLLYFATHSSATGSGVMLTASHNPANYNGLKIIFNQRSLVEGQIQSLRQRIADNDFAVGQGELRHQDITEDYLSEVCNRINLNRPLKVVVDCGNAVPGSIAPQLFSRLGCEVVPLFCDIDGSFPNHHPDPTLTENLQQLIATVQRENADLGIAFDGDGDRLGLVTNLGEAVGAEKLIMLLSKELATAYPGEAVVFDVKCSRALASLIREVGMEPVMHRSGHSYMKQKMQQTHAPLGGEYAAHIFIKDRWFGFDDGLYNAARIMEIISSQPLSASEVFSQFPLPPGTPEIKLPVKEEGKFALMQRIADLADFPDADCITLDGLRVEFDSGWGLIRASNTSPALLLRFEAETNEGLQEIKERFKTLIRAADRHIKLNF